MDLSRREFISQMGIKKTVGFLGGLFGGGILGSLGVTPRGSADEAARDLARKASNASGLKAQVKSEGKSGEVRSLVER